MTLKYSVAIVGTSVAAISGAGLALSGIGSAERVLGANERVRVAAIGTGRQGQGDQAKQGQTKQPAHRHEYTPSRKTGTANGPRHPRPRRAAQPARPPTAVQRRCQG